MNQHTDDRAPIERDDSGDRVQEHAFERRWWILAVLCFSLLVIVLDNSILNVAIPTLVRDLDASNSDLQWIVDAYTLVFAGLLLTAGALGDRYGRRSALQVGFVVFGLGSLASAFASSSMQLTVTRAVMGLGAACIMPATLSIITNTFPDHERGRAIGVWAGTAGLGSALGPLTGGFLLEHFYWGSVFLVNLPIVLVGLVAGFFLIPNSKDPAAPRVDPLGALLSIAGLIVLLYAIIEAPDRGWTDPATIGGIALGLAILGGFAWHEWRSDHPMLDVHFFSNPRFSAASAAITLTFFAMFGSMFLLTQYLQFVLGYTPLETGVRLLPLAFTMMVTAPLSPRLAERIGTKLTVALGLGLVTSAFLLFQGLAVDSSYGQVAWRLMVMAVGMGLTMAPATESIMGSLPLAKAGVGSAVNDTTRQVGGALGVAVIGSVLATVYGNKIADVLSGAPVPPDALDAAQSSLGGAYSVAERAQASGLPDAAGLADRLLATANAAFVDAMHAGVLVAAASTAVGVVVVLAFLPARARARDEARQHAEFAEEHAHDLHVPADVLAPVSPDERSHDRPVARPVLAPTPEAAAE